MNVPNIPQSLSGKTALITGGTSGIGLAVAQVFQLSGAHIIATGRSPEGIAQAQTLLGEQAHVLPCNQGSLSAIETLMQRIGQLRGQIDVLVLNAGTNKAAPLAHASEADFDDLIAVNLKGTFFTLQKALPLMKEGGSVIFITSIGTRFGTPGSSIYSASKAALVSLMQTAALELIGQGIRVNAISPGPIDTPIFDRFGLPDTVVQQRKMAIREKSPSRRFGTPEEVAHLAAFLASDAASYVVGTELVVDGGMSIQRPIGS